MRKATFERFPGFDTEEYKGYRNMAGYFLLREIDDTMDLIGPNNLKEAGKISRSIQKEEAERREKVQKTGNPLMNSYFDQMIGGSYDR